MECGDGVAALDSSGAWVNTKRIQDKELRTSEIELRAEGLHRDSVVGCDALESAQRPPDVIDGGASAAILDVNKSVPVDDYGGPDFGLTDRGLPHTWILQVGSILVAQV